MRGKEVVSHTVRAKAGTAARLRLADRRPIIVGRVLAPKGKVRAIMVSVHPMSNPCIRTKE